MLARIDEHNTIRTPFAYDGGPLALRAQSGGPSDLQAIDRRLPDPVAAEWRHQSAGRKPIIRAPGIATAVSARGFLTADGDQCAVLSRSIHGRKRRDHGAASDPQAGGVSVRSLRGSLDGAGLRAGGELHRAGLHALITAALRTAAARAGAVNQPTLRRSSWQQIDLPAFLGEDFTDDAELRRLLGYEVKTPRSDGIFHDAPRKIRRVKEATRASGVRSGLGGRIAPDHIDGLVCAAAGKRDGLGRQPRHRVDRKALPPADIDGPNPREHHMYRCNAHRVKAAEYPPWFAIRWLVEVSSGRPKPPTSCVSGGAGTNGPTANETSNASN